MRQQGAATQTAFSQASPSSAVALQATYSAGCAERSGRPAPEFIASPFRRPLTPGVAVPFRPVAPASPDDFLSSRRLTISRTTFDSQWERVSHSSLSGRTVIKLGLATKGEPLIATLGAINAWTNRQIRYTEDSVQYGKADYWAAPRQTLRSRAGDCEDIAIVKMQLLAVAGVPRSAMYLTIARDLARHADHALLVVRDGDRHWLLDNATDTLIDASTAQDYRPIFSFSETGKWLHGY